MHIGQLQLEIRSLIKHRNFIILVATASLMLNIILGIIIILRQDKIILMPAHLSQPLDISRGTHSIAYLQEMTAEYLNLWLDVTPLNLEHKAQFLSRHIDPEYYKSFINQAGQTFKKYTKSGISTSFIPKKYFIDPDSLKVKVLGNFTTYVTGSVIEDQEKLFQIIYTSKQGKLFITNMSEIDMKELKENKKGEGL